MKKQLNPTIVYVLSIFGLLCCCFFGLGSILAAIAFFIAQSKIRDATLNPDAYEGDIKAMNTAKIVALVVFIINILYLVYTIYSISSVGWDEFFDKINQAIEEVKRNQ